MEDEIIEHAATEARRLGIEPAALLAVIAVESAGRLFASVKGKPEPLIRFEGHWFYRRLSGPEKARARLQGLAAEQASVVKNPASQTARWALLERAMKINRQAALESTSWGMAQVMGGHWKWLGYDSIDALVEEARSGVAGQLGLMLRFIEKSGLIPALQQRDWKRFAVTYNGPNAIRNGYDRALLKAYRHWSAGVPETGVTPARQKPTYLQRGSSGEEVTALQDALTARGLPVRSMGSFDLATEKAVIAFQKLAGLKPDGIAGPLTLAALSENTATKSLWKRLMEWLFGS